MTGPQNGMEEEGTRRIEDFLVAFLRVLQAVRLYEDDREAVLEATRRFVNGAGQLLPEGEIPCLVSEGYLYVQGERVRYRKGLVRVLQSVADFLSRRNLKGLVFSAGLEQAPLCEVVAFLRLLLHCAEKEDPYDWLVEAMGRDRFPWVELVRAVDRMPGGDAERRKERTRAVYTHANASVREISRKLSMDRGAGVRKSRRMVQNLVDLLFEDETVVLAASTIRDHDQYTFTHSVNVAILSLCLGKRIGLSPASLTHLGICGLFHDLGKVEISTEILQKPSGLTEEEWETIRRHPVSSLKQVLRLRASHGLKSKVLLAPLEHHLRWDLSGYPRMSSIRAVSLFGRILQITDFYDALTSPRPYRPAPFSPHKALKMLLEGAGKEFDPILVKVFAAMMGRYPIGTLVRLDTGEIGLVAESSARRLSPLPKVVLLVDNGEGVLLRGQIVDLAEKDPHTGSYLRRVTGCCHPSALGIQPAQFLL